MKRDSGHKIFRLTTRVTRLLVSAFQLDIAHLHIDDVHFPNLLFIYISSGMRLHAEALVKIALEALVKIALEARQLIAIFLFYHLGSTCFTPRTSSIFLGCTCSTHWHAFYASI